MASYYEAAARSIAQNCSNDWSAVTHYVDSVFMDSRNETEITELKFALLKARLSGPGGNTTGTDGLTLEQAAQTSDLDAASILMDPLDFYQVLLFLITSRFGLEPAFPFFSIMVQFLSLSFVRTLKHETSLTKPSKKD